MSLFRIIFVFLIFALVPARAKIFAQAATGTTGSSIRRVGIEQDMLDAGIDSLLHASKYSRDNISVMIDTTIQSSIHGQRGNGSHGSYIGELVITQIHCLRKALNSSKESEEGIVTVTAEGVLCCLPINVADQKIAFTRMSRYKTIFESHRQGANDSEISFWDSTAKPILVTLGAVLVIALFFLIRG